ncbi:MAG TPA: hypothetical protein VFJ91_07185 [Gaiellaceae bacterium]|nr:hypothetical protein [Gaiellaceae bacterium]
MPSQPAPGRWSIEPRELVSGQETRLELRYANGGAALPPGAWFRFDLEPLSVKSTRFCPMSEGLRVVACDGEPPEVRIEAEPQTPWGFKPVRLVLPHGMRPGQSFGLRIGNESEDGELLAIVTPSPVHELAFDVHSGVEGEPGETDWFEAGWGASLPRCSIEAAPASALRVFAPSLVAAGSPFAVRLAVVDAYDSPAHPAFEGVVRFDPGPDGLPEQVELRAADGSTARVDGVTISRPGVHRLVARLGDRAFESNPIVVRERVDVPIRWGQLHGHDWHSECWGDGPDHYYRFGRDVSGLDFLALTDHVNVTPREDNRLGRLYPYRFGRWPTAREAYLENLRAAEAHHRPGSFATLIGYELSPYSPLHFNVLWADASEESFERIFVDEDGAFLAAVEEILSEANALVLPHMHATYVPYNHLAAGSTAAGEPLVPAVEGYSDWGMDFQPPTEQDELIGGLTHERARPFYEWAGRGIDVGFVADSDTHTGLPGRRHPGGPSPVHLRPQGITAVRARELTRQGVVDGYRSRWTYGTSGERIFLDVRAGGVRMGEELVADGPFTLSVEVAGTDTIARIGVYDPSGLVAERRLGDVREATVEFELPRPESPWTPYFVEVVQADCHRAWSSPVRVRNGSLPDLRWRGADGSLHLENAGGGAARGVTVAHHPREHPFAAAAIRHPRGEATPPWAKVWTHRWNDHRTTLFLLWKDVELAGTLAVEGCERYEVEPELIQFLLGSVEDDGAGRIRFSNPLEQPGMSTLTWGFNVTVDVSHRLPTLARLELDAEAEIRVGAEVVRAATLALPLNGLTAPFAERIAVGDLAPGEHWLAPSAEGLWAADPDDEILELSETGNLYGG